LGCLRTTAPDRKSHRYIGGFKGEEERISKEIIRGKPGDGSGSGPGKKECLAIIQGNTSMTCRLEKNGREEDNSEKRRKGGRFADFGDLLERR